MRLVTYEHEGTVGCGALVGHSIAPLPHASVREILEPGLVDLEIESLGLLANPVVAHATLRR